jgi:hypothetical protein
MAGSASFASSRPAAAAELSCTVCYAGDGMCDPWIIQSVCGTRMCGGAWWACTTQSELCDVGEELIDCDYHITEP